ncbi:MAG: site-2 protease family protein [Candidatus Delongbacteria bacterium]|nr:site-2 protease family protein [Candidatus Delongbacteria bacterium]MDD4205325.1 site-2 protease family protein [Candidatus Delongbacteria bacterium]
MDPNIIIMIIVLLFSVVFHEVSHGWVAFKLGDDTAHKMGRLTLNPIPHIDPYMTVLLPLMLGFMTGWRVMFGGAKPVPVNPYNFKNPKKGMAITAAAGPVSNLILITASVILFRILVTLGFVEKYDVQMRFFTNEMNFVDAFFVYAVLINTVLMVFNLIPIPPLDGSKIIMGFLSYEQAAKYESFSRYGMYVLIGLLFLGSIMNYSIIGALINPFINFFLRLLLG